MIIWGLKNCDTCRKALKYCDENGIAYNARDVRSDGLDRDTIARIVEALGVGGSVNRRSTTWRNLAPEQRENLDETTAIALLADNPTLLKRPVFIKENSIFAGFGDNQKARLTG